MNNICSEIEKRIIEMWFEGYPRDEIAKVLGISGSTVSERIDRLPKCLTPLRDLSKMLRKLNLLPIDALKGINVIAQLGEQDVTAEQIPFLIDSFKKIATESIYQPEQLIKASTKTAELESQSGKEYPEAIKDFETAIQKEKELVEKNKKHEEENSRLQSEIKENKKRRNQTLRQANASPKEAREINTIKSRLRVHGADLNDGKNLARYLDNMKETGYDPHRFVAFSKKHSASEKSLTRLERRRAQTQAKLCELDNSVRNLDAEKRQEEAIVSSLKHQRNLLRAEIESYSVQLREIKDEIEETECVRQATIDQIARMQGMDTGEAANLRFQKQLEFVQIYLRIRGTRNLLVACKSKCRE